MKKIALHWLGHSVGVVAATALLVGCAEEAPLGPNRRAAFPAPLAASAQVVDLGGCDSLQVPAGSELAFHAYATGVQIYHWNGTSWTFDAPSAVLSSDAGGSSTVGTHSAGPTWQSISGSKVVGAVVRKCPVDPNAIPWLLLRVVSDDGPGVFNGTAFIQRVNTVGGNAPLTPGSITGELTSVPYTAEYLFYRAPK